VAQAVLAAVVHDNGAHQQREQDGGDHCLLLRRRGEGPGKGGEPVAQGGGVLPLAHCGVPELNHGWTEEEEGASGGWRSGETRMDTDGIPDIRENP